MLASGSVNGSIRTWAFTDSSLEKSTELLRHDGVVEYISWNPQEENTLVSGSKDGTLRLWDSRSSSCSAIIPVNGHVLSIAWQLNGYGLAVGTREDQLIFVDSRKTSVVASRKCNQELNEIAFLSDDILLMGVGVRGTSDEGQVVAIGINDSLAGEQIELARVRAHTASVLQLKLSNSREKFCTGSADSVVCVWDKNTLSVESIFDRGKGQIRATSWSHDDSLLAISSGGREDTTKMLEVCRVEGGTQIMSLELPCVVTHCAWSPKTLALAYAIDDVKSEESSDAGSSSKASSNLGADPYSIRIICPSHDVLDTDRSEGQEAETPKAPVEKKSISANVPTVDRRALRTSHTPISDTVWRAGGRSVRDRDGRGDYWRDYSWPSRRH